MKAIGIGKKNCASSQTSSSNRTGIFARKARRVEGICGGTTVENSGATRAPENIQEAHEALAERIGQLTLQATNENGKRRISLMAK